MTQKIQLQDLRLDNRYKKLKELSGKEFLLIQEFIAEAKNGENNKGIDITEGTERKYIDALVMAYHSWKKPLLELNKKTLTKLKQDLKSGKLKSRFKKPYSERSQREMELILIRFLEYAQPKKFSGMRKWFIIKVKRRDVDFLRETEIEKLRNNTKDSQDRCLISMGFCSGGRISEILNVRAEDITEPTQSFPYYKINFKEEYSKTKGRNIGLYWKYCTEDLRNYLKERGELKPKDTLFTKSYDAIRIFLTRLGKQVLGKRVYFHLLRKSSATYYAQKLKSRQQLCYRYGWNFSSDVPDVYISREQGEEEVKENIKNTDMAELEKFNQELKTKLSMNNESLEKLRKEFEWFLKIQGFKEITEEELKQSHKKFKKEKTSYLGGIIAYPLKRKSNS